MGSGQIEPRASLAACVFVALGAWILGCASGATPTRIGDPHPEGLPPDVRSFLVDQNRCDMLRGEVADGDPRAGQLEAEEVPDCAQRAAELARLRAKYPDDIEVQDALQFFVDEDDGDAAPPTP